MSSQPTALWPRFCAASLALSTLGAAPPAPRSIAASIDSAPSAAAAAAARFCRPMHFVAYSTLEPSGQHVEESITWDAARRAYVIHGPVLAYMLNDPGAASVPNTAAALQMTFEIAIRQNPSKALDRFCEYGFQEWAQCDTHGDIFYTQSYTGCDLQTLQHVIELTPDSAGSLPLLELRFQDVQGNFSDPMYLSAGTDLRQRVR